MNEFGEKMVMRPFPPFFPLLRWFALGAVFLVILLPAATAEVAIKSGDKIAFYGDSITVGGWINISGYVRRVMAGLEVNGVEGDAVPAGIRGAWSAGLLGALDTKVLAKKPRWMTLFCGADELWPQHSREEPDGEPHAGVGDASLESYQRNISQIVTTTQAAGIQTVLLTVPCRGDDPESAENVRLAPYNEFLRTLAKEKKCLIVDLAPAFLEGMKAEKARQLALAPGKKPVDLHHGGDGVHMRVRGDMLIATGILQAFGLNAAQLKKAQDVWDAEIQAARTVKASLQDYAKAQAQAKAEQAVKDKAEADELAARQAAARAKAEQAAKIKAAAAAKADAEAEKIKARRATPAAPVSETSPAGPPAPEPAEPPASQ